MTPAFTVPPLAPPRPHLQERHYLTPSPLPPPTPKSNPAPTTTRAPPPIDSSKRRSPADYARTLPPSLPAPPADPVRAILPPGFSPSQPQRTDNPAARARTTAHDRVRRTPAHGGRHRAVAPSSGHEHTGTRTWLLLVTSPSAHVGRQHAPLGRVRPCHLCATNPAVPHLLCGVLLSHENLQTLIVKRPEQNII